MVDSIKYILILIGTVIGGSYYQPYYDIQRATLQDDLTMTPCVNSPETNPLFFNLSSVFNKNDQVSRITVTGWYLFKGLYPIHYCLLSLHNVSVQLGFICYNSANSLMVLSALGQISYTQDVQYFTVNQWNFIILDIQFDSVNINLNGMLRAIQTTPANIPLNSASSLYSTTLLLSDLQLNIGYPPMNLQIQPSCSIIKNISILLNSPFDLNSLDKITDYISKSPTLLISHLDFYYSQYNPGYLINDRSDLHQKLVMNKQTNLDPTQFNLGDTLQAIYYQLNSTNEYVISFYLNILSLPSSVCSICNINYNGIQISADQNSIYATYSSVTNSINMVNSQWNHIVMILNFQSVQQFTLLIEGNTAQSITFILSLQPQFVRIEFSPQCSLQLNHIRIYQGSGFYSTSECQIQSFDGTCILCNSDQLLDFQNNMQCIMKDTTNTDFQVDGIKDWNPQRNQCQFNMINDSIEPNNCKCIIGYYFDGQLCQKCPSYCVYCTSLQTCSSVRDSSGQCQNSSLFDDGVNCLEPLFVIPNIINQRVSYSKPQLGSACNPSYVDTDLSKFTYQNIALNTGETIFFSFSFQIKQFTGIFSTSKIATITSNTIDVLTISFYNTVLSGTQYYYIRFDVSGVLVNQYQFYPLDSVWIGYWTDNNKHIFLISTNGFNYYDQVQNSQQFYSENIQIIIGRFSPSSIAETSNNCFSVGVLPFTLIKNITYSTDQGINQLFTLMAIDVDIIVQFKFDSNQSGFLSSILNTAPTSSVSSQLAFSTSLFKYNNVQGFGLSQLISAQVTQLSNWSNEGLFTFSCNLEFDSTSSEQFFQFLFIQYLDSNDITFYLDVDYTLQIIRIVICSFQGCKSTKYAVLLFNQSNFIYIHATDTGVYQLPQFEKLLGVDIVCNSIKETFTISHKYTSKGINSILLAGATIDPFLIYFDNIRIYQSYGFVYYDYNNQVPCFIYQNVSLMTCLRLKSDYLYYQGNPITREQCLQIAISTNTTYVMYDKEQICEIFQTYSYIDSLCQIGYYSNGQFVCSQCKDINSDPLKQCTQCKSNYYLDQIKNRCIQCSSICQQCSGSANNCTHCLQDDQYPPSCNCIFENYYLDQNLQCSQCSSKCGICTNNQNLCLTCSSPLRILPNCDCPSGYSDNGQLCIQQFSCSSKCDTCSLSPQNCESCSVNRINPPLCQCAFGYIQDSGGNCIPCSSDSYFDQISQQCIQCPKFCVQCDQSKCQRCQTGLDLIDNLCSCPNSQVLYSVSSTQFSCLSGMDLTLQTTLQQNTYIVQFVFEQILLNYDFQKLSLVEFNNIVVLYLPEVNSSYYQFINPAIVNNQLRIELKIFKDIHVSSGIAIIKNNSYFVSNDKQWILKDSYINKVLNFKIGPLLLENMDSPILNNLNSQLQSFRDSNSVIFQIINQLQLLFYLLNTLQPISVFLLLNANYPPTLYQFYQFIGTLVFPSVPNYQSTDYKSSFSLFEYQLDGIDSQQPKQDNYQKLGFCLSLLINIPIVVIKYALLMIILGSVQIIQFMNKTLNEKLQSLKIVIVQRMNCDLEASLLILLVSIFAQFQEVVQNSFFYRIGFYLAILLISLLIGLFYFNYTNVMNAQTDNNNKYSSLFLERVQDQSSNIQRSYFLLQLIKKYLYVTIVCFFYDYPFIICGFNSTLLFISAFSIYRFRVYRNKTSKCIKFFGDFLLSLVWILHIIILRIERLLNAEIIITSSLLDQYLTTGNVILIILITMNILFLIQIFIDLYLAMDNLCSKKQRNQDSQYLSIKNINKSTAKQH